MNNYYLPFGLRILDPKVEVIKQCVYKDFDINIENSLLNLIYQTKKNNCSLKNKKQKKNKTLKL
jgi:hypothetical protein|tara:strand:+ start:177 stop:368 length:192 start_codon:yes stop_codon:yes gene_type:complete